MSYYQECAIPKPTKRKTLKGRKTRAEQTVKDAVRTTCVERDGHCRILSMIADRWIPDLEHDWLLCSGPSAWAHMHAKRRSKTRGMAPELRHDTAHSLMLCQFHHAEYDAKRLIITATTRKGADGPLRLRRAI